MVAAGYRTAGSITSSGDLLIWGYLYDSFPVQYPLPTGLRAAKVAFGQNHVCVLTTAGSIYCSGEDQRTGAIYDRMYARHYPCLRNYAVSIVRILNVLQS